VPLPWEGGSFRGHDPRAGERKRDGPGSIARFGPGQMPRPTAHGNCWEQSISAAQTGASVAEDRDLGRPLARAHVEVEEDDLLQRPEDEATRGVRRHGR
jgi:hypothetical protein